MNILPRDKQIEIIAALTEGCSIRAVERLTGVHRDTIMRLGARVGRGPLVPWSSGRCLPLLQFVVATSGGDNAHGRG